MRNKNIKGKRASRLNNTRVYLLSLAILESVVLVTGLILMKALS